jgi:uncharacterized protein (DUF1778 family)
VSNDGCMVLVGRDRRIGVRVPSDDVDLLKRICRSRGEDVSDFIRRAIRSEFARLSFLKPLDKKALGIKTEQNRRLQESSK